MDPNVVDKFSPPASVALEAGGMAVNPLLNFAHVLIGFIGVAGFMALIFSAFTYITSLGEDEKIVKAKKGIAGSIAAIGMALLAEVITRFILEAW